MATNSKAKKLNYNEPLSQGDIFKDVKFSFISGEDDENIDIIEYVFPYAIIISQACDVLGADLVFSNGAGKPTKFMPSILMCPIFDRESVKTSEHIKEMMEANNISLISENIYDKKDLEVIKRDWHYRFHSLNVYLDELQVFNDSLIDFKQYFTVNTNYLIKNKSNRICTLDPIFSEQITLKFSTYLSRVAIP